MIFATIGLSLLWVCGAILAFRLGRYITTPLFKRLGLYRYYSPMFFTQPFGPGRLELHLGTTWDFFSQKNVSQQILLSHLGVGIKGLLDAIRSGEVPMDTKLRGTIYFLSSHTIKRFGFVVRKPLPLEYVAFLSNYIEICLLQSIIRRRLSIIDIRKVRMINATARDLVENENSLDTAIKRVTTPRNLITP